MSQLQNPIGALKLSNSKFSSCINNILPSRIFDHLHQGLHFKHLKKSSTRAFGTASSQKFSNNSRYFHTQHGYQRNRGLFTPPPGFQEIQSDETYTQESSYRKKFLLCLILLSIGGYFWEMHARKTYQAYITALKALTMELYDLSKLHNKISALEERIRSGQNSNVNASVIDIWIKELYDLRNERERMYKNFHRIAANILQSVETSDILFSLGIGSFFPSGTIIRIFKQENFMYVLLNALKKEMTVQTKNEDQLIFVLTCIKLLSVGACNSEIAIDLVRQEALPFLLNVRSYVWMQPTQRLVDTLIVTLLLPHTHHVLPPQQLIQIINYGLHTDSDEEKTLLTRCLSALNRTYNLHPIRGKLRAFLERTGWISVHDSPFFPIHILDRYPHLDRRIYSILLENQKYFPTTELLQTHNGKFITCDLDAPVDYILETYPVWGAPFLGAFAAWWVRFRSHPQTIIYVMKKQKRVAFLFIASTFFIEKYFLDIYTISNTYLSKTIGSIKHVDTSHIYIALKMIWFCHAWLYSRYILIPLQFTYFFTLSVYVSASYLRTLLYNLRMNR